MPFRHIRSFKTSNMNQSNNPKNIVLQLDGKNPRESFFLLPNGTRKFFRSKIEALHQLCILIKHDEISMEDAVIQLETLIVLLVIPSVLPGFFNNNDQENEACAKCTLDQALLEFNAMLQAEREGRPQLVILEESPKTFQAYVIDRDWKSSLITGREHVFIVLRNLYREDKIKIHRYFNFMGIIFKNSNSMFWHLGPDYEN